MLEGLKEWRQGSCCCFEKKKISSAGTRNPSCHLWAQLHSTWWRERQTNRHIYCKELAHMIMIREDEKSHDSLSARERLRKVLSSPKTPWGLRRADVQFESEGRKNPNPSSKQELPLTCKTASLFVLLRASTDWMRPTHTGKGDLHDSVYLFQCQSHPGTPSQTHAK